MNLRGSKWEVWLPFIKGGCCVLIMTDMTSKLKEELGIWETGDWLTQPREPSDNCIWLLQQTQRQGVEWEDNGRGHQGISGSSVTLYTECFAFAAIGVVSLTQSAPINSQSYCSNALIWGDSVDYWLQGNHSGICLFYHPWSNHPVAHNSQIAPFSWHDLCLRPKSFHFFLFVLLAEQKGVWYKSVWVCNGLPPQGHGFVHWKS